MFLEIYNTLHKTYGDRNWWPIIQGNDCQYLPEFSKRERTEAEALEIAAGAILTQNTAWDNVKKALINLKDAGILSYNGIKSIEIQKLAGYIKPSGYFNQKAKKLKLLMDFIGQNLDGKLVNLQKYALAEARILLLSVWGIGLETADSILLYALNKPIFVVDAYTRKTFSRIGLIQSGWNYDIIRKAFEDALPKDTNLFKEYHALIVELGKNICRPKPNCERCSVNYVCNFAKLSTSFAQECT
jgi:endonuclease III related protein